LTAEEKNQDSSRWLLPIFITTVTVDLFFLSRVSAPEMELAGRQAPAWIEVAANPYLVHRDTVIMGKTRRSFGMKGG
jgi:hypothetical protein